MLTLAVHFIVLFYYAGGSPPRTHPYSPVFPVPLPVSWRISLQKLAHSIILLT